MIITNIQRKIAEQLLISILRHEDVLEYSELMYRIDPPIRWSRVSHEITAVSKLCYELGLPLISAKVITKWSDESSKCFFNILTELKQLAKFPSQKQEKKRIRLEIQKIKECQEWYRLAEYLKLNLDFPNSLENSIIKTENTKNSTASNQDDFSSNYWIFPSNNKTYNVISAFEHLPEIFWRQRVSLKIGDTVYIYCTKPYQKIMFQTVVIALNIPFSDTFIDKAFWNKDYLVSNIQFSFAQLRLVKVLDMELLSLPQLLENGLGGVPQSELRVNATVSTYIDSIIQKSDLLNNVMLFPEEIDANENNTYTEGAKKQITVNAYERNSAARSECVRIHGSKCAICGFDFGSFYGKDFSGKIHVHHIKPLHEVDATYQVDPLNDLIPICPNCHMVIHLKQNGVYTIDEVKKMINSKSIV